jgi:hypothetical protein
MSITSCKNQAIQAGKVHDEKKKYLLNKKINNNNMRLAVFSSRRNSLHIS